MDGIDAALVDFDPFLPLPQLIATSNTAIPHSLQQQLHALCIPGDNEIIRMARADIQMGQLLAEAVLQLIDQYHLDPDEIAAIASHGQTIRHLVKDDYPNSLQIGDPNTISYLTKITTIADFRRKDIAAKGQGAPLVPAFHQAIFSDPDKKRIILNIGGIANITLLEANKTVIGFDTGPGNTLLDQWIYQHRQQHYDSNGSWAKAGTVHLQLLQNMLQDSYFSRAIPKSTGREDFNLAWLQVHLNAFPDITAIDVQATLLELTAQSIAIAIHQYAQHSDELLVCGGGVHNHYLMQRLQQHLQCPVVSTEKYGLHPDWVEACAFAWLGWRTLHYQTGNLPSVTGASQPVILGAIYPV